MSGVQSLSTISGKLALQADPKPLQPVSPTVPQVSHDDIEWAKKFDKKMELGWIPPEADQKRYNSIVGNLKAIRDGGGYVYEDKTSFNDNPRGFSAIGSLVGRAFSGGYIGYKYSHDMANITHTTFTQIKTGIGNGNWGEAFKGLAGGVKASGIIALKAGGISSAINAGTSVVSNVFETISGRQTGSAAIGNVAADTVGGFLSGVGASTFSGIASLGLSLAGTTAGLPLTLIGVAGGVVGSVLIDKAYKASGLFSIIKTKVTGLIDTHPQAAKAVTSAEEAAKKALNKPSAPTTNSSIPVAASGMKLSAVSMSLAPAA